MYVPGFNAFKMGFGLLLRLREYSGNTLQDRIMALPNLVTWHFQEECVQALPSSFPACTGGNVCFHHNAVGQNPPRFKNILKMSSLQRDVLGDKESHNGPAQSIAQTLLKHP